MSSQLHLCSPKAQISNINRLFIIIPCSWCISSFLTIRSFSGLSFSLRFCSSRLLFTSLFSCLRFCSSCLTFTSLFSSSLSLYLWLLFLSLLCGWCDFFLLSWFICFFTKWFSFNYLNYSFHMCSFHWFYSFIEIFFIF